MIKVKNGGEIQRGDIIAVATNNYISIGIYLGRGQGGTVQYLWPGFATSCKNWHERKLKEWKGDKPMRPLTISQMGKSYVNTPDEYRIMKLNRDNITDQETIEKLLEDKEVLKEFKITVNY
jgi:hypothetical protein